MPLCRRHPRAAALMLQAGAVVAGSALAPVGVLVCWVVPGGGNLGGTGAVEDRLGKAKEIVSRQAVAVAVARPSCAVLRERGPPSSFAAGFSASTLPFAEVFL